MRAVHLRAHSFRLYAEVEARFAPTLTAVIGPNGSGKTSLLEALHLGLTGTSPRTSSELRMIRAGESSLRVETDGFVGGARRTGVVTLGAGAGKRLELDGISAGSVEEFRRGWSVLAFLPERLAVVKQAPSVRRSFLDYGLSLLDPSASDVRDAYGRALAQRSALLRNGRGHGVPSRELDAWDLEAARTGSRLVALRTRLVERLGPLFKAELDSLSDGDAGPASLTYETRGATTTAAALDLLQSARLTDLERGQTTSGPHLDDLRIEAWSRDVRAYASQGEQRIVVLALLLALSAVAADVRGEPGILLFDDVLSELDPRRRELLLAAACSSAQVVVTTADRRDLAVAPEIILECGGGRVRVLDGTGG